MDEKTLSGIIHCANYACNGCPYKLSVEEEWKVGSSAAGYVKCMQKLIEDVYKNIKETDEND